MAKSEIFDDRLSASRTFNNISAPRVIIKGAYVTDGTVGTPFGFVTVHAEYGVSIPRTELRFIWNQVLYIRTIKWKYFTPKGLVYIASRYARSIATKKV